MGYKKMPHQSTTPKRYAAEQARRARLHSTDIGVNHEDRVGRVVHGSDEDKKLRAKRATGRNNRALLREAMDAANDAIDAGVCVNPRRLAVLFR